MNQLFLEKCAVKLGGSADINVGGLTGERIGLKDADKVAIIIQCATSTGASVVASLQQHDAASGGNSKVLNVKHSHFVKAGAATAFTKTEVNPDADPVVASVDASASLGDAAGILVLEVLAEDLDTNGGFTHISCNLAAAGAAKAVDVLYVVDNVKFKSAYELDL